MLIIAFIRLYEAFEIKSFNRFNIDNVDDEGILMTPINAVERGLCKNYKNIVSANVVVNDDKVEHVQQGFSIGAVGFLMLSASAIGLVVLIG